MVTVHAAVKLELILLCRSLVLVGLIQRQESEFVPSLALKLHGEGQLPICLRKSIFSSIRQAPAVFIQRD
jgi:hypothetical protein